MFATVAVAVGLLAAAPSYAAITAPVPVTPSNTATTDQTPVFGWNVVTGAVSYSFQLSTDAGFNSVVFSVTGTKNTRVTVTNALNDDTYWWRVRAVNSAGAAGPWSTAMQFTKSWTDAPVQESPADGSTVTFPDPLILNWDKTPYAASYHLVLATDPQLTNVVYELKKANSNNAPNGTQFAPQQLSPGTYYWEVWPVDASGHEGQGSGVWSFDWVDPDAMTNLQVTDMVTDPQVFDPLFSWDPVPGARAYQIEVNPAADFSTGSTICCGSSGTNGYTYTSIYSTSYAPTTVLENNTLYWRVRPVDVSGAVGQWTEGTQFTQDFDIAPPSVTNLRLLSPDGSDLGGTSTDTPIVAWDPVPGASYYEVNVTPFTGGICDWAAPSTAQWQSKTASTYWTPLGSGLSASKPYSGGPTVSTDQPGLTIGGNYCVRVRADRDRAINNSPVFGSYTYLGDGASASFTFSGYPGGSACSPSCNTGYLGDDDSILPIEGSTNAQAPLFTWNPIAGKQSYWVIVAKDPSFTTIVDYAWTKIPAYAPRTGSQVRTLTDESTSYYWAVLPATNANGSSAVGNPLLAAAHDFLKQSDPPTQDQPLAGSTVDGAVQFQWELALGARKYHLIVSNATGTLADVTTDSTSWVAPMGLPQGAISWKVVALDETGNTLTWTPVVTFTHNLDAPVVSSGPGINPASGPDVPAWQWQPVDGAVKYGLEIKWDDHPGHSMSATPTTTATAWSASSMTGLGTIQWRVHALFQPASGSTLVAGADTPWQTFDRTIPGPTGLASDLATNASGATRVLTTWNPSLGAASYKVDFSTTNSFTTVFESGQVQNAAYAPLLSGFSATSFTNGGTIYWRVAAVDDDSNTGSYTVGTLSLPTKTVLTSTTSTIHKGVTTSVTFTLKTVGGTGVVGASVHVSGAGVTAATKTTGTGGKVTFKLKPTKTGKITVTASKTAFYKTSMTLTTY